MDPYMSEERQYVVDREGGAARLTFTPNEYAEEWWQTR